MASPSARGVIIPSLFPFWCWQGFWCVPGSARRWGGAWRSDPGPVRPAGLLRSGDPDRVYRGYPTGGMAVGELVESGQIHGEEGRRMLRFCVNGGPAFIISAVGAGMMGSVRFGVVLFTAHLLASLLIGIGGGIGARHRRGEPPACGKKTCIAGKRISPAAAFVESVNAACRSLLYMCGFCGAVRRPACLARCFRRHGGVHPFPDTALRAGRGGYGDAVFVSALSARGQLRLRRGVRDGEAAPLLLGGRPGLGGCPSTASLRLPFTDSGSWDGDFSPSAFSTHCSAAC